MSEDGTHRPGRRLGVSDKLLVLTILFVMIAEVLIYIPSIANYRNLWLSEKLDSAAIVALAIAGSGEAISEEAEQQMLASIDLDAIAVRTPTERWMIAREGMPDTIVASHDLTQLRPLESIGAAFASLFSTGDAHIMVAGKPPAHATAFEIVLSQAKLRSALRLYSRNILLLSMAISIITAMLVYGALRWIIVRPVERLTDSIFAFSSAPEAPGTVIVPSGRRDEIGAAEERLADMQKTLRETLSERRHLADLGLAVSKINHDLRNILASAQLFSDSLAAIDDPMVKRFAPKVIRAIDRAIGYTQSVLSYGKAREAEPRRQLLSLARLADDVADVLGLGLRQDVEWENRIAASIEVDADPEQLFRVVMNLCRNSLEAVTETDEPSVVRRIHVEAERRGGVVAMRVCDTGPGVPEAARAMLFEPFRSSVRGRGTGLGLAIAAELVQAHGGQIRLVDHAGPGSMFEFTIPDRPVDLQARRRAQASSGTLA